MTTKFITFYQRFAADILSGKKIITIRDAEANYFESGDVVHAYTFETRELFAALAVHRIEKLNFEELSNQHAAQENMTLAELRTIIKQIYPDNCQLYVITFQNLPLINFHHPISLDMPIAR